MGGKDGKQMPGHTLLHRLLSHHRPRSDTISGLAGADSLWISCVKHQPQITHQGEERREGPAAACPLPPLIPIYQNDPMAGHAYISGLGHLASIGEADLVIVQHFMASEAGQELTTWGRPEALHGVFPSAVSLGGKGPGDSEPRGT